MRKMTVLGASALLVAGLMTAPAAAFAAPIAGAPVAATPGGEGKVCPEEGKVPGSGQETSVTVVAPDGMVIVGYCVKAGSYQQGDGPETVDLAQPVTEITFSHSSGKAISHYTVFYAAAPTQTPSPSPSVPGDEPSEPGVEPSEPGTEPSEPGTEPSEPGVEPTEGDTGAAPSPSATTDEPEVLAATGASTVIGFTLIALALVGGGVTLIVLRRKGVLGS